MLTAVVTSASGSCTVRNGMILNAGSSVLDPSRVISLVMKFSRISKHES